MKKWKPIVTVIRPGLISYQSGLQLQNTLTQQPSEPFKDFRNFLVLQEFYPVYTTGIRQKNYTEEDEYRLRKLGADFYRTNRGGLITFHGPGQIVAYPLLHLKQFKPSIRWYVTNLEQMVIKCCRYMGISSATTTQDTGIWVEDRKICAIGVHGSRYITTHGIALNCCTDLSWFEYIVPCGIKGKGVTSLTKELQRKVTINEATNSLLKAFSKVFSCDMRECSEREYIDLMRSNSI